MYPTCFNSFHRWGGWGRRSCNWGILMLSIWKYSYFLHLHDSWKLKALSLAKKVSSVSQDFIWKKDFKFHMKFGDRVWQRMPEGWQSQKSGGGGDGAFGFRGRKEKTEKLGGRKVLWNAFAIHEGNPWRHPLVHKTRVLTALKGTLFSQATLGTSLVWTPCFSRLSQII